MFCRKLILQNVRVAIPQRKRHTDHVRKSVVHEQQAVLHRPDGDDLHLLNYENPFGSTDSLIDLCLGHDMLIVGIDEVAARPRDNRHADHEHRVGDLFRRVRTRGGFAFAHSIGGADGPWQIASGSLQLGAS